jgi:hypothetical protein
VPEHRLDARFLLSLAGMPLRHVARRGRVQREAEAKARFAVLGERPHDQRLVAALQPDRMHVDES